MEEQNRILVWCLVNVNVSQPVPSCFFVSLISDDGNWIKTNFHFSRLACLLSCPDPHTYTTHSNPNSFIEHSTWNIISNIQLNVCFPHSFFLCFFYVRIFPFPFSDIKQRFHCVYTTRNTKSKNQYEFLQINSFCCFFSGARLGHIQKDFHSNGFRSSSSPSSLFARCAIFRFVGSPTRTNNAQLLIAFLLCSSHNISLINWNIFFAPFFCASSSPVHADSTL